ncbi:MAG: hypothetical protein P8020_02940 [Acidobacteriota bacterium]
MHCSQLLRRWGSGAAFLSGIIGLAAPCLAGTTLNFPRLSFEPGTCTGIAIANPTDFEATVTLTAYGGDGTLLAGPGVTVPQPFNIKPHQQYTSTTYELFGPGVDPSTVAWFQADSSVEGLTGFFLYLNGSVTFFDGADLPSQAREIVFNLVRLSDGWETELNLINPGNAGTAVQLTLMGGSEPVTKALTLPAKGAARLDAASFFGDGGNPATAYCVVASASVPIAGFELVRGSGDLLGLNARPASETLNTLFFPHFAVLGTPAYESEVVVVNYGNETVILTLSAFQPDGTLFGSVDLHNNPVTRTLTAKGVLREDVASMFGFKGEDLRGGWIKVEATSQAVNGSLTYSIPESGSVASVACEPQGRTRALFSHLATTLGYFTGLAVLNGGTRAANIRVVAVDKDGSMIGTYSGVLRPKERLSRGITELVEDSADRNGGMVWVSSDVPVYMTGLFVNLENGVLTNVPPQPVPETFLPDADQARLTVSPTLAVLSPGQKFTFDATGVVGTVTWGVSGGQHPGTIDWLGVYHSPSEVPDPLPVTVTASSGSLIGAASIDVLRKEELVGGLGVVQSVVYLLGMKSLYSAELLSMGGLQMAAESPSSNVLDVTTVGEPPTLIKSFAGDEIAKMIAFQGADAREYLLLAGKTSGKVIRLNPVTRQSTDVATGLNSPSALVIDPVTGDLLVAEADRVRSIPRAQLNSGLVSQQLGGRARSQQSLDLANGADGITVDPCTGKIYVSSPTQGAILEYDRGTEQWRIAASGLNAPGQMLAIYRDGFTCPQAFHLLVVERGLGRVLLVIPAEGSVQPWVNAPGATDLAFLPEGNPFSSDAGVFVSEAPPDAAGRIALAETPGLYTDVLANPPILTLDSANWATTSSLPVSRLLAAAAAPGNGYIYSIDGGTDGTACSLGRADGRVFYARQNPDGTLGTWLETEGGEGNFTRAAAGVAVDNGFIYIAGGAINAPSWDGNIWYAKPWSDGTIAHWEHASTLPGNPNWLGSWPAMAAYDGYLYVGGGRNAFHEKFTDRFYVAPLDAYGVPGAWREMHLPTPSFQGQLVFYAGRAYLIVGVDNCDGCVSTQIFTADVQADGSLDAWKEARALPEPARQASAQIVDGHLVVLPGGTAVYESEILEDGSLGPWNTLDVLPESALPWAQGVYSNGYYYLVGDQNCGAKEDRLRTVYFGRVRF